MVRLTNSPPPHPTPPHRLVFECNWGKLSSLTRRVITIQIRRAASLRRTPALREEHRGRPHRLEGLQRQCATTRIQTWLRLTRRQRVVRPPLRRRRHLFPHTRRNRRSTPYKTPPPLRRAPHRPPTRSFPRRDRHRRRGGKCGPMGWQRRRGKQ